MKKGRYQKPSSPKPFPWVLILIGTVLVALLLIFLLRGCGGNSIWGDGKESIPAATVEKNTNSISVPGYEMLTFKADTTKQEISLANPPQNTCVFIISLYLEDGTLLWQSDEIKPGKQSNPITLRQPLAKGVYANARLVYECFTDDNEHRQLNGAEMKLNLRVQ